MRYFFDTEFIDDGKTIDLISIGIVSADGREYYAEALECDLSRGVEWVQENVVKKLTGVKTPRAQIAAEIRDFVGTRPQFWAWYADYDWVVLCQLYGTMLSVPKSWPNICFDVRQLAHHLGNPRLPLLWEDVAHNALVDARWCRDAWQRLQR